MKKLFCTLLAMLLVLGLLAGCTSKPEPSPGGTDEPVTPPIVNNGGSDGGNGGGDDDGGLYDGRLGDTIETYFFDFVINSAYLCDDYHGYKPQDGNTLLVVDIDIENTTNSSIPMMDYDFQAQWGETSDDAYSWPITTDPETGDIVSPVFDKQLPAEYELAIGERINGELVYEVPSGYKDFSISSMDSFADDSEGDLYFVYFTAGYM